MPIPLNMLPMRATVTRRTNVIGTLTTGPGTIAVTATINPGALVQMQIGTPGAGMTVLITGELNGVGQTETLPIPTSGIARSTKIFTKVTSIAVSVSTGSVAATFVYASGEEAYHTTTLYTNSPCRIAPIQMARRAFLLEDAGGLQLTALATMMTNIADLAIGDRIECDGVDYEVNNPIHVFDSVGFHHAEPILQRLNTAS